MSDEADAMLANGLQPSISSCVSCVVILSVCMCVCWVGIWGGEDRAGAALGLCYNNL